RCPDVDAFETRLAKARERAAVASSGLPELDRCSEWKSALKVLRRGLEQSRRRLQQHVLGG
ncbi:unnamed protein product, partial [Amoebophrya sp. A25]